MTFTPVFLGSAAFVFLNFALPIYTRDQGVGAMAIGGLYSVFTLTMLLARPLVGWALDRFGRKRFYTAAFLFYALACLVFAAADTLIDFYLARFLQGIGASLMWVSARTMIADITGDGARAETMGQLNATSIRGGMVGAVYGFTLLGMMPIQQAWSWAFGGYALLALAGLIVAAIRSPETRTATPPSQQIPVQISVPLRRLLMIVLLSNFASALVEPIYLIYLQDKFSLGIRELAFAFFPAGIVYATLPRYAGRLTDRVGRTPMIALGVSCAALVSLLLPWLSDIVWVAACYTLFAAGWALAGPAEDALVGDLSSDLDRGRVFGFKEAAASAGAALGPLVGGAIYDHWRPELAFVTNGLLLLVTAALVTGWLQRALTRHDNRADA